MLAKRLQLVAELVAVATGYLVGLITLCGRLDGQTVHPEDLEWIVGEVLGSPLRLTQHALLNHLSLPLLQDDLSAYFTPGLLLHLACAASVHWLFVVIWGALPGRLLHPLTIRAGGAAAGLLFLLGQPSIVVYPSALSYQLVTLWTLLALVFCVLYLRSGRLVAWAAVVLCYGLALFSHSYAVALPLLVMALEVAWNRSPRSAPRASAGAASPAQPPDRRTDRRSGRGASDAAHNDTAHGPYPVDRRVSATRRGKRFRDRRGELFASGALLRYLALAIPAVGMAIRISATLPRFDSALASYKTTELGPWLLLYFARYLGEVLLRFGQDAFGLTWLSQFHRAGPDLKAADVGVLVLCLVVAALGLRQLLWRRLVPGLAAMLLLFFLLWNGICLVQTYLTSDYFAQWWRFYYNAAGLVLVLAYGLVWGMQALSRLVWPPAPLLAWGAAAGLVLACLWMRPAAGIPHPMVWARDTPEYSSGAVPRQAGPLDGKSLRGVRLGSRKMVRADLRRADLYRADLAGANLAGARLAGASLLLANLQQAGLSGANLRGALMVHARLTGVHLNGAVLVSANLEGASLTDGDLRWADLRGAHLAWATLEDADLRGADLRRANLRGARLGRADLRGADLRGVRLQGARLEHARLQGARVCKARRLPTGYRGTPRWSTCSADGLGSTPH